MTVQDIKYLDNENRKASEGKGGNGGLLPAINGGKHQNQLRSINQINESNNIFSSQLSNFEIPVKKLKKHRRIISESISGEPITEEFYYDEDYKYYHNPNLKKVASKTLLLNQPSQRALAPS